MALKTKTFIAKGSKGYHTFTLTANENSTNLSNYSSMSYSLKLSAINSSWIWRNWGTAITWKIIIGDKIYTGTIPNYDGSTFTVSSGNFDITHDNNGSKTIDISLEVIDKTGTTYTCGNAKTSGTMVLTNIPRQNKIECPTTANIGSPITIKIKKTHEKYTSSLHLVLISGETSIPIKTIVQKTTNDFYTCDMLDVVDEIYQFIPNSKEIDAEIWCYTFDGDTQIGDCASTASLKLYAVENDCRPTIISPTVTEKSQQVIDLFDGDTSKFVKYVSKPEVTVNAIANKSASLKNYFIDLNDGQRSDAKTYSFNSIDSNIITTKVIDSRGYQATDSTDLSEQLIDYIIVKFDGGYTLERTEEISSEVVLNASGQWFNGNFTDSKSNVLTAKFQYKKSEDADWSSEIELTPIISGNKFKFLNVSLGNSFDYESEYQFRVFINDILTEDNISETVSRGQETIAIGDLMGRLYGDWKLNDLSIVTKNDLYPVGSIYISTNSTNPSTLFGGTWERIKDRFLLSAGDSYTAGSTGGEATHTLTLNEIPSHKGHLEGNAGEVNNKGNAKGAWLGSKGITTQTDDTSYGYNYKNNEYYPYNVNRGGSKAHNNMPPYLTVYMWKRIS